MVQIKNSDIRKLEHIFGMNGGYVLDFSNRTFKEFFFDELRIDIYSDTFSIDGKSSKANRLRAFWRQASVSDFSKSLELLVEIAHQDKHEQIRVEYDPDPEWIEMTLRPYENDLMDIQDIIERVHKTNSNLTTIKTVATFTFKGWDSALDEISRIEKYVAEDPPAAITAAQALLEATMKHILYELKGESYLEHDLLKLFKLVRKELSLDPTAVSGDSAHLGALKTILSGLNSIVQGVADLRAKKSSAHAASPLTHPANQHIVELAVESAFAAVRFLYSTFEKQKVKKNERSE